MVLHKISRGPGGGVESRVTRDRVEDAQGGESDDTLLYNPVTCQGVVQGPGVRLIRGSSVVCEFFGNAVKGDNFGATLYLLIEVC